jgi:predicted Zn-dependent protease with MMP-like domain
MKTAERERFDALMEEALEAMPPKIHALLEEVPVIVDDRPEGPLLKSLLGEFGIDERDKAEVEDFAATLCGLHSGVPLTERSVETGSSLPEDIHIFREGIVDLAGGWDPQDGEGAEDVDDAVYEEIMITLLHEIGHHFGLDEDQLAELGYE